MGLAPIDEQRDNAASTVGLTGEARQAAGGVESGLSTTEEMQIVQDQQDAYDAYHREQAAITNIARGIQIGDGPASASVVAPHVGPDGIVQPVAGTSQVGNLTAAEEEQCSVM